MVCSELGAVVSGEQGMASEEVVLGDTVVVRDEQGTVSEVVAWTKSEAVVHSKLGVAVSGEQRMESEDVAHGEMEAVVCNEKGAVIEAVVGVET